MIRKLVRSDGLLTGRGLRILLWLAAGAFVSVGTAGAAEEDAGYFATLKPGSQLPSGQACAERIRRSAWEPRPENHAANNSGGITGVVIDGADAAFNARYGWRISGNFAGTTDEILQWGACKWGFDENITRARAIQESYWRQSQLGDETGDEQACAAIVKSPPCWQSYGVLQVKGTVHEGTHPTAEESTAFNVDYALAWLRACYEGAFGHWLGDGYGPGDEWGCVGTWYSGNWYDGAAKRYILSVKRHLANRVWEQPGF